MSSKTTQRRRGTVKPRSKNTSQSRKEESFLKLTSSLALAFSRDDSGATTIANDGKEWRTTKQVPKNEVKNRNTVRVKQEVYVNEAEDSSWDDVEQKAPAVKVAKYGAKKAVSIEDDDDAWGDSDDLATSGEQEANDAFDDQEANDAFDDADEDREEETGSYDDQETNDADDNDAFNDADDAFNDAFNDAEEAESYNDQTAEIPNVLKANLDQQVSQRKVLFKQSNRCPEERHCRPGPPGCPGKPGKCGTNGRCGTNGKCGEPGPPGKPGKCGTNGKCGTDGTCGTDGCDGKDACSLVQYIRVCGHHAVEEGALNVVVKVCGRTVILLPKLCRPEKEYGLYKAVQHHIFASKDEVVIRAYCKDTIDECKEYTIQAGYHVHIVQDGHNWVVGK